MIASSALPVESQVCGGLDSVLHLKVTLTAEAFDRLSAHRALLSREKGRRVALGVALDDLIKSHPLLTPKAQQEYGFGRA